jgi:hypothetical protein
MKDTRKEAMNWWNNLASLRKTQICDTNTELVGSVRRWETLTGREIEMLYLEINSSDAIEDSNKNRGSQRSPFGIGS